MMLTYLKYALGLTSVLLLILIALLLLFSPLPGKKGEPIVGFSDSSLPLVVGQVDAQIHASFFSLGISKEDIKSIQTQSRQYQDLSYPFVREEIALPKGVGMEAVRDLLTTKLKSEFPTAKVDFQEDGIKEMTVTVALGNAPTHSLHFFQESEMAFTAAAATRPRIAIIIDGVEGDLRASRELVSLKGPLTFSIPPGDKSLVDIAGEAYQRGHEVLLRLPLGPQDFVGVHPGSPSLVMTVGKEELQEKFRNALKSLPYVKGVNSPLSSFFIEEPAKTVLILKEVREAGLYFFDSRPAKETVEYILARNLGVKTAERNIVLDNLQEREAVYQQLVKLSHQALKEGWATAIGHPFPVTVSVLKDNLPKLKERGFELVPLSRVVK